MTQSTETSYAPQNKERDVTFDVLKGIAIILVIVGHCEFGPFRAFIYSFHMPLFFFVAGYFLKKRPLRQEIYLSTKRLIIPYIFAAFWLCVATTCINPSRLQSITIACLLGFRSQYVPNWIDAHVGLLWFILALFWARIITVALIQKVKSDFLLGIIFFALALIGMFLNKRVFVPFCIPQGLCAAGFIFVGHLIKKHEALETGLLKKIFPLLAIIWAYNWTTESMDMYICFFRNGYIFDLIGAIGAFTALHAIVQQCYNNNSFLWRSIRFWGRFSLILYCVHSVEHSAAIWKTLMPSLSNPLDDYSIMCIPIRMCSVLLISFLLFKIRPIREKVFQIKNTYSNT